MGEPISTKIINFLHIFLHLLHLYLIAFLRLFIPPSMKSIDGESILVTGAAGGIGSEICKHLVRSGSNLKLVMWDLNKPALDKLVEQLEIIGKGKNEFYTFAVDISSKENIYECSKKVKDTIGPISIVFNNAGILRMGNFLLNSDSDIEKTVEINFMSNLWITRQFIPDMVKQNHGRIINTCSMAAFFPTPSSLPYVASKYAVNGYTEALKMELDHFNCNIHVTTVYPYFVKSPLIPNMEWDKSSGDLINKFANPFSSFLEPEVVGRKIVDGMRREYEYIYLPSTAPIAVFFMDYLLPTKVKRALLLKILTSNIVIQNEKEHERCYTPYSEVVNGRIEFN